MDQKLLTWFYSTRVFGLAGEIRYSHKNLPSWFVKFLLLRFGGFKNIDKMGQIIFYELICL